MVTTRKLKKHPRADASVEIEPVGDGVVYRLDSFGTRLAYVTEAPEGWYLDCYPIHSATELRHVEWFLDDISAPFTVANAMRSAETGRIVMGYVAGTKYQLVDGGVVYDPANFDDVMAFVKFLGLSRYTIIDAATGEVVREA